MTNVALGHLGHLGLSLLGRDISLLLLHSLFFVNDNFFKHLKSCGVD